MQRLQRPDHLLACERQAYRVPHGLRLAGSVLACPCLEFVRINDQVLPHEPAHGSATTHFPGELYTLQTRSSTPCSRASSVGWPRLAAVGHEMVGHCPGP